MFSTPETSVHVRDKNREINKNLTSKACNGFDNLTYNELVNDRPKDSGLCHVGMRCTSLIEIPEIRIIYHSTITLK